MNLLLRTVIVLSRVPVHCIIPYDQGSVQVRCISDTVCHSYNTVVRVYVHTHGASLDLLPLVTRRVHQHRLYRRHGAAICQHVAPPSLTVLILVPTMLR